MIGIPATGASAASTALPWRRLKVFFGQDHVFVMPDIHHSHAEDRYIAYGSSSKGRPMFVAFTFRIRDDEILIRPISARYMHEKEAKEYEEKNPEI